MKAGEEVINSESSTCAIETLYFEIVESPETVYNFHVEDYHTYHVGMSRVLVHNKCGDGSTTEHMLGSNGTQVSSKTTWRNGTTERIDVENPAPSQRPGQIHYHDANNNKYYYDINNNTFYDPKTGELAPSSIQKKLNNTKFTEGIKKALQILGE